MDGRVRSPVGGVHVRMVRSAAIRGPRGGWAHPRAHPLHLRRPFSALPRPLPWPPSAADRATIGADGPRTHHRPSPRRPPHARARPQRGDPGGRPRRRDREQLARAAGRRRPRLRRRVGDGPVPRRRPDRVPPALRRADVRALPTRDPRRRRQRRAPPRDRRRDLRRGRPPARRAAGGRAGPRLGRRRRGDPGEPRRGPPPPLREPGEPHDPGRLPRGPRRPRRLRGRARLGPRHPGDRLAPGGRAGVARRGDPHRAPNRRAPPRESRRPSRGHPARRRPGPRPKRTSSTLPGSSASTTCTPGRSRAE